MPSVPTSGSVPPPPPVWDARPPETAVRYAGFWLRVVAAIVDAIMLTDRLAGHRTGSARPAVPPMPENAGLRGVARHMPTACSRLPDDRLCPGRAGPISRSRKARRRRRRSARGCWASASPPTSGGRLSLLAASIRTWPIYLPTCGRPARHQPQLGGRSVLALIACVAVAFSAASRACTTRWRAQPGSHRKAPGRLDAAGRKPVYSGVSRGISWKNSRRCAASQRRCRWSMSTPT